MSKQEPFRIIVVCGAPHVGKTTLIASLYDAVGGERILDVIDMRQFQGDVPLAIIGNEITATSVSNALVDACVINRLVDAAKLPIDELHGSCLVIEGTYMKAARRAPLLQSIKTGLAIGGYDDLNIDVEIVGIQVNGSEEMLRLHCPLSAAQVAESERMRLGEGYDSLVTVTNAPEDGERYIKVTGSYSDFMVVDYHEPSTEAMGFVKSIDYDRIMRDDLLGYGKLIFRDDSDTNDSGDSGNQ